MPADQGDDEVATRVGSDVEGNGRVAVAALPLLEAPSGTILSMQRWMYAQALSRLLVDLGFHVEWWQPGDGWTSQICPGVPLRAGLSATPQLFTWPNTAEEFRQKAAAADYAIYFDFILAYPQAHERSISLSHGIHWDDPLFESRLQDDEGRHEWMRRLWLALAGPLRVVSSDTSLIQWATTTWPGLQHKFVYIPNFVPEPTLPAASAAKAETSFTVLFAAPMRPNEGVAEAVRALTTLLARHEHLHFWLIGPAPSAVAAHLEQWARATPRARYTPDSSIDDVLSDVDAVLIPAKSGQGTSIACLQAMAAGKPVIVGQTGGLTDMVIHEHNGIVIGPLARHIVAAVEYLLNRPERCRAMGTAARDVAESFSMARWRTRWHDVLQRAFR